MTRSYRDAGPRAGQKFHHDEGHHDEGLAHDLPRLLGRRRLLSLMGGLGLATASGGMAQALECVALPWETAGPYPADGTNSREGQVVNALAQEGILREDLRVSFGDYAGEAEGVLLTLELTLQDADGCTPLAGHAIYLWHCDGQGNYSLYDLPEQNFLRGLAVADENGVVRLTTILPGCYDGRWPHIHFEIFGSAEAAVSGEASVLTAQIALPADVVGPVYESDSRYEGSSRALSRITLGSDNVFGDNTEAQVTQQTLEMTADGEGFAGTLVIPVDFDADRSSAMPAPPPGGMGGDMPPPPSD